MPRARILGLAVLLAVPFAHVASGASTPSRIVFSADLAPSVSGEIYRLDPNGHRVDLSRSPFQDTDPVVSPDGKHVAFLSNRGGHVGLYEVGIDGRGLVAVAPRIAGLEPGSGIAWQPHGERLAVGGSGTRVAIVRRGHRPIYASFPGGGGTGVGQPWSPDGRVLLVGGPGDDIYAVNPEGRALWSAQAGGRSGVWSARGLLAIPESHGVRVYDESGRLRFRAGLPRQVSVPEVSWSPEGAHLAIQWGNSRDRLEVRSAAGKLELERRTGPSGPLAWARDTRPVLGNTGRCRCRATGIDLRTGKSSAASLRWLDPLSANRKLAIVTAKSGPGFSLGVASPSAGRPKAYALVAGCFDDGVITPAAGSLQFAGRSRSLVYQSWWECDPPFSNVYSVAPDDTGLQRLTDVAAQETQPALSPTGSQIAYVWADATGLSCKGCSDGIRVMNADGSGAQTLTDPEDCTFDDSPTWSPDGSTILYSETGCDSAGELFTVPAAGGAVRDLGIAGTEPAWGPSRIAYVTADGLWTANPDGSDPIEVAANGKSPAWSPDGRLAYLVGSTGKTIVVGSTQTKLPFGLVSSLAWSPDGTRFVVTAHAKNEAAFDVYTVNTDGTDPVRLTWNYDASGVGWR